MAIQTKNIQFVSRSYPLGGTFYALALKGMGNLASCVVRHNPQTGGIKLLNLFVDPAYRGNNLATTLMNGIFRGPANKQPNELVANPYKESIPKEKLQAFYEKFDFTPHKQLDPNRLLMIRKGHPYFADMHNVTAKRVDIFDEAFPKSRPITFMPNQLVSPKIDDKTRRIVQRLHYQILIKINRLDIDNAFFIYLDGSIYNRPNGRTFFVSDPYDHIENVAFLNRHFENEQKVLKAGFVKVKEYKDELVALVYTGFESYTMSDAFQTLSRIMKRRKIRSIKVYPVDKFGRFDRYSFGAILEENKARVLTVQQLMQSNKRAVYLPGFA